MCRCIDIWYFLCNNTVKLKYQVRRFILITKNSDIGKLLSLIREELYLTQEELGDEIGFSRSRIAEIENMHDDTLPLETLYRLYYLANTLKQNIAMNEIVKSEANELFNICDSKITQLIRDRYNGKEKKLDNDMKQYLRIYNN